MNIPCTLMPNVFVNSSSVIMHRKKFHSVIFRYSYLMVFFT